MLFQLKQGDTLRYNLARVRLPTDLVDNVTLPIEITDLQGLIREHAKEQEKWAGKVGAGPELRILV